MSIESTKAKMAVMQAFLDGEAIEYKSKHDPDDKWESNDSPGWAWEHIDYRIAQPEPREAWGTFHKSGSPGHLFEYESEARTWAANTGGTYAKFVEVL